MEKVLLAASIRSRESFQLIDSYINDKKYSRAFQIVLDQVKGYFARDTDAESIDLAVLKGMLAETTRNDKHLDQFYELVDDAAAMEISEANVKHMVLTAKKQELGLTLAQAIVEEKDHADILEEYQSVSRMAELSELTEQGVEVIDASDFLGILAGEADTQGMLRVYPHIVSERIGGGLRPGHHVVVFAPTEAGKTALTLTITAGFARQRADGIYFGNEDRPQDMLVRLISCLTGLNKPQVLANPEAALEAADAAGLAHVRFISISPGTPKQLEEFIEKYRPRWIVVDQLRNLAMKSDNRVVQLEAAATAVRNLAKKHKLVAISVTQAGDSATDKEVLTTGDVDFSNVGIPAQADVMIGIGVTAALENQGVRCFSLPKNKLSGDHSHFYVRLDPGISRYTSL